MWLLGLFDTSAPAKATQRASQCTCLRLESLEERFVPYALTGNAWPNPQLVTLSFVPDGTLMTTGLNGNVYSNLFATFNAKFGSTATWQDAILNAAQAWAQQANINLSVVSDNGTTSGQGNYQQGDPGMGDIRIGGYAFSTQFLAGTYLPPGANNYSIAGDMNFNTGQAFNIGTTYDLQTVALHEFGHAFGMGHSSLPTAVMYRSYTGLKQALTSDDISGIQAIYGPRQSDAYNTGTNSNSTFSAAVSLTSLLDPTAGTALVNNLDITSTSTAEYFTVVAPATTSGTLTVDVQSAGLSLLTPAVTVYAADQTTVLGSASGAGLYNGANLTVTVTGVTAGQTFFIAVTGADKTAFSTGNYALAVNFGTGATPTAQPPNTQLLDGNPLTGGGAIALAVADMLAVSDQYSCSASFAQTGFPHGPGCGCAMCRGAMAAAVNNPMMTSESQLQNPLASASLGALPVISLDPSSPTPPVRSTLGSVVSDAYFIHQDGEDGLDAFSLGDD